MPMYTFSCNKCEAETIVLRDIDDYRVPPKSPCSKCGGTEWTKHVDVSTTRYHFCDD